MSLAIKVLKRAYLSLSMIFIRRSRRSIRHVILGDFDLLVAANEDVGRNILLFRDFEPDEAAFFRSEIQPTDICFDIGGNVGFFSMLMAARAKHGQVHVFEPIPLNAALIQTNAFLNQFENVTVNNTAVGGSNGTAMFSISVDSAYSSIRATGRRREESSIEVQLHTLDNYVMEHGLERVDILKVDVEGAEGMVVSGATELLSNRAAQPRVVLLELFEANLRPFGTDVITIVNEMIGHGYAANVLIAGKLEPFKKAMTNNYYNIIFTSDAVLRK